MATTTFDTPKNLAISTVLTAPSPTTTGTSLVVASGTGSRFGVGPATLSPASSVTDPTTAEIIRITNVAADTLTITRAQESTSARAVVIGDFIYQGPTAKTITDITSAVGNLETPSISSQAAGYTLALSDVNDAVLMTNATSSTLTIPANASVAFPVGTQLTIIRASGAGVVTIAITTDTLRYYSPTAAGTCQIAGANAAVSLIKTASTTWYALGAII